MVARNATVLYLIQGPIIVLLVICSRRRLIFLFDDPWLLELIKTIIDAIQTVTVVLIPAVKLLRGIFEHLS
jgi:hypothetical protein